MKSIPVSVVMPAYNAEAFLEQALSSVREQTVRPAEMIVVDDGSKVPVASRIANKPDWLTIVTLDRNRGPGVARNAGVDRSTQPFVAFLDADDIWIPRKLETQYELMRAWPDLDATHTDVVFFMKDGSELQREHQPRHMTVTTALSDHQMITPSIMVKRSSFQALGGFDPRFRCTQDWELQIRMALVGLKTQFIPEVLVRVRREDHGNHSSNWRCYLAGHLGILFKHRRAYVGVDGYRGWLHRFALELYRGGLKQGGWLGRALKLPFRMGL